MDSQQLQDEVRRTRRLLYALTALMIAVPLVLLVLYFVKPAGR